MLAIFIFSLLTLSTYLVSAKKCPAPPVQQNFDIPKVCMLNLILKIEIDSIRSYKHLRIYF